MYGNSPSTNPKADVASSARRSPNSEGCAQRAREHEKRCLARPCRYMRLEQNKAWNFHAGTGPCRSVGVCLAVGRYSRLRFISRCCLAGYSYRTRKPSKLEVPGQAIQPAKLQRCVALSFAVSNGSITAAASHDRGCGSLTCEIRSAVDPHGRLLYRGHSPPSAAQLSLQRRR